MAIDFPNSPSPGDNLTVDGKTWTFTDGKWALNVGVGGVQGPAGVAIQGTAPVTTDILWVDTSDTGLVIVPAGGTAGQMLAKSSSASYDTAWATPVTSSDLSLKSNLASPEFTGVPLAPTASAATNTTQIATTAFVRTEVANLVASAPAALDTLDELAAALGDDANFASTTATAIGLKAPLASPALTGTPTAPTASAGTNTTQIATTEFVQVASPTGAVIAFAGSSAPTNWLLCYGQAVSRTTYAALFAVVSTTYGVGDGTTTFNLPDLRGRGIAGVDNMGGSDAGRIDIANSSGTVVGSQYVTLTAAQSGVPAHQHANTLTNNAVTSGAGSAHAHGNTLTGTTTFASNGHSHAGQGSLNAAIGATNGNPNRIGYIAGTVAGPGTATYSIEAGGLLTGTANFNHYTPVYGSTGGNSESASVGISNANESAHNHSVTSNVTISNVNNTAANAAESHSVMQPTMVLNYIIKA
jgi:microcystin-dependent protein